MYTQAEDYKNVQFIFEIAQKSVKFIRRVLGIKKKKKKTLIAILNIQCIPRQQNKFIK